MAVILGFLVWGLLGCALLTALTRTNAIPQSKEVQPTISATGENKIPADSQAAPFVEQ